MSTSPQHAAQGRGLAAPSRARSAVLQRACACGSHAGGTGGECEGCKKKRAEVQRQAAPHATTSSASATPPIVRDVLCSSGQPLDTSTRAFMESRFRHDFSSVRVHTDQPAAESARAVDALAYTVGQHVVFGRSRYAPHTADGRTLLAHELTHTIQQPTFRESDLAALRVTDPGENSEREAADTAEAVVHGAGADATGRSGIAIARASCWSGARCATPQSSAGAASNKVFSAKPQVSARAKRKALCKAKDPACTADGHGGRAMWLEKILDDINPLRRTEVRGVFVDMDFPAGAAAFKAGCQDFEDNLGGELHPFEGPRTGSCLFFPKAFEDQAREFHTTQNDTIGGRSREMWLLNARRELTHESEHARFDDTVTISGPTSGPCSFAELQIELSEISARLAEFPIVFHDIRVMVAKTMPASLPPSRSALDDATWQDARFTTWLNDRIASSAESIKGSVKTVRCACACDQADKYIRETAFSAMNSLTMRWTEDEKVRFNTELRLPKWGLDWPVDYPFPNRHPDLELVPPSTKERPA